MCAASREHVGIYDFERLVFRATQKARQKRAFRGAEDEIFFGCALKASAADRRTALRPHRLCAPPRANTREFTISSGSSFAPRKKPAKKRAFRGAEDEIRTRATYNGTTPLAGEPLEPLGYFCMRGSKYKCHINISYSARLVKAYFREFEKNAKKFLQHLAAARKVW